MHRVYHHWQWAWILQSVSPQCSQPNGTTCSKHTDTEDNTRPFPASPPVLAIAIACNTAEPLEGHTEELCSAWALHPLSRFFERAICSLEHLPKKESQDLVRYVTGKHTAASVQLIAVQVTSNLDVSKGELGQSILQIANVTTTCCPENDNTLPSKFDDDTLQAWNCATAVQHIQGQGQWKPPPKRDQPHRGWWSTYSHWSVSRLMRSITEVL